MGASDTLPRHGAQLRWLHSARPTGGLALAQRRAERRRGRSAACRDRWVVLNCVDVTVQQSRAEQTQRRSRQVGGRCARGQTSERKRASGRFARRCAAVGRPCSVLLAARQEMTDFASFLTCCWPMSPVHFLRLLRRPTATVQSPAACSHSNRGATTGTSVPCRVDSPLLLRSAPPLLTANSDGGLRLCA